MEITVCSTTRAQDTGQQALAEYQQDVHTCMYIVQPIIQHTYVHGIDHDKVHTRSDALSHQCMLCLDVMVCTVRKSKKRVWPRADDKEIKACIW